MRYTVDMAIFDVLPAFTRVVLVVRDLDNTRNDHASRNMLQKASLAASTTIGERGPMEHAHLAPWQRAYEAFGMRAFSMGERLNTAERTGIPSWLLFRTQDTPLAKTLNAFALQNRVPAGGDDLDTITGNVWLRPARGTEFFVPVEHPERPESPEIAEIVYVDDGPHVLRRHWHGRPGNAAPITPHTENAVIYLDCLPPVSREQAEELSGKLANLISGFFNAQAETYFLTHEQPAIEIRDSEERGKSESRPVC